MFFLRETLLNKNVVSAVFLQKEIFQEKKKEKNQSETRIKINFKLIKRNVSEEKQINIDINNNKKNNFKLKI